MTLIADLRALLERSMSDEGDFIVANELLDRIAASRDAIRDAALEEAAIAADAHASASCALDGHDHTEATRLVARSTAAMIRALKSQPATPEGFDALWTGDGPDPRIQPPREQPRGGERVSDKVLAHIHLRPWSHVSDDPIFASNGLLLARDLRDARQTIAKLTEENERLSSLVTFAAVLNDDLQKCMDLAKEQISSFRTRAEAAEAEVARLCALLVEARDALRPMKMWNDDQREKPTLAETDFAARLHAKLTEELRDA